MKIAYIRVSTAEQKTLRQETLMSQLGVDKIYMDSMSGSTRDRPELKKLLDFVREGDCVIVESISRFARNTRDLLELVDILSSKSVEFISLKEKIDTSTPSGKFMLTVFAAVAELERDYILQRQREGICEAKKAGKYKGRKPIAVDVGTFAGVYGRWKDGEISARRAQQMLSLSPSTFYRRVKDFENDNMM